MFNVEELLDGLKLSSKYLSPVAVAAGVLLFGPASLLGKLGVSSVVVTYRGWIGVVFLVSASILAVRAVLGVWHTIGGWILEIRLGRAQRRRLERLTPAEKQILRGYFQKNTRSQSLDIMDGVVKELEAIGIIGRTSSVGVSMHFAYNIQPWAWDYLKSHLELLADDKVVSSRGRDA
jgi:hypothetical protein